MAPSEAWALTDEDLEFWLNQAERIAAAGAGNE
jgi:hypothetical protein